MEDDFVTFHLPPSMHGRYRWLSANDYPVREPSRLCVSFMARGKGDITMCLASDPDSVLSSSDGREDGAAEYELVIGGWNNTRPALRRLGRELRSLSFLPEGAPLPADHAASATPAAYKPFWLSLDAGTGVLAVGSGRVPGEGTFLAYTDPDVLPAVARVGISCWRHPVSFASIVVTDPPKVVEGARSIHAVEEGVQQRPGYSVSAPNLASFGPLPAPLGGPQPYFADVILSFEVPGGRPPEASFPCHAAVVLSSSERGGRLHTAISRAISTPEKERGSSDAPTPNMSLPVARVELPSAADCATACLLVRGFMYTGTIDLATVPAPAPQHQSPAAAAASSSSESTTTITAPTTNEPWASFSSAPPSSQTADSVFGPRVPRESEEERERASSVGGADAGRALAEAATSELRRVAIWLGCEDGTVGASARHGMHIESRTRVPSFREASPEVVDPGATGSGPMHVDARGIPRRPATTLDLAIDLDDGVTVFTSRVMVASFSDVFLKMLTSHMREANERRIELPRVPAPALLTMLTLLAGVPADSDGNGVGGGGDGDGKNRSGFDLEELSPADRVETLAWTLSLAHRLQTPRVTNLVLDLLSRAVNADTAVRCLGIAEEFRLEVVRSNSVAVAAESFSLEDTLSDGWSDLPAAAVADVLSHSRLNVADEFATLAAALVWLSADPETRAAAFSDELVPCVRFGGIGGVEDVAGLVRRALGPITGRPGSADRLSAVSSFVLTGDPGGGPARALESFLSACRAEALRVRESLAAASWRVSSAIIAAVTSSAARAIPEAVERALVDAIATDGGGGGGPAGGGWGDAGEMSTSVDGGGGPDGVTTAGVTDAIARAVTAVVSRAVGESIPEAVREAIAEGTTVKLLADLGKGGEGHHHPQQQHHSPQGSLGSTSSLAESSTAVAHAALMSVLDAACPTPGGAHPPPEDPSPARTARLDALRAMRRRPRERARDTWHDLPFVSTKEAGGVIAWLATRGFTRPYANPHDQGIVTVTCSSPVSRYTQPSGLVDKGGARSTSYATGPEAWFAVDLGPNRALICTHYLLTLDKSQGNELRWWTMQGSRDGEDWVDLRRHEGDTRLSYPGQTEAWAVNRIFRRGCRHFRVLLSPRNPNRLAISKMEFFGKLRVTTG